MKVTIYKQTEMMGNIIKMELTMDSYEYIEWAQYKNVLRVVGTPKRKRSKYQVTAPGYKPFMVVAEGWDCPEPDSMFVPHSDNTEVGRYSSCDDGWVHDFMNKQYKELKVVTEQIDPEYKKAS
jgi:hypothetical protein